jgi:hypothetical protein
MRVPQVNHGWNPRPPLRNTAWRWNARTGRAFGRFDTIAHRGRALKYAVDFRLIQS